MRTLTVRRKEYHRKAYTKKSGIRIPATYVKPSKPFSIRDVGTIGRGVKRIKIARKGALKKLGYSVAKPEAVRRRVIRKAVKKYGATAVFRMLQAQVRFREMGGVAGEVFRPEVAETGRKFQKDRNYVSSRYKIAPPLKAIRAWKAMPPSLRARKMRLAKGLSLDSERARLKSVI